ncbi:hypothetical protein MERGE_000819 [Pneumocystis wakefieldiae]|uniref:carnosine N-methyltransferase n=1 Tax=Pneumocystis wakefieldiae TaxID=38082 RepID=A0A899G4S3_9ASCO|nr:hypothetical protein MERGE_000819 [Pneumocystis wakefieldiae]
MDEDEEQVIADTLEAFKRYGEIMEFKINIRRVVFRSLDKEDQAKLAEFEEYLNKIEEATKINCKLANDIEKIGRSQFLSGKKYKESQPLKVGYIDKVLTTIKQFWRDWSKDGMVERDKSYKPIIDEIESKFMHIPINDRKKINVLVPGAGLGRLPFDIALKGFSVQGNEFSYFMLISSFFLFNYLKSSNKYFLFPFIHTFSNHRTNEDLLYKCTIPDINPRSVIFSGSNFSTSIGEFTEVYSQTSMESFFDVIATCFFIDTAPNIVSYIKTIRHSLKPGGFWINLGPLLWHYEKDTYSKETPEDNIPVCSIEITLETLIQLIKDSGFEIDKRETINTTYVGNPRSMLKYIYETEFWVARKKDI